MNFHPRGFTSKHQSFGHSLDVGTKGTHGKTLKFQAHQTAHPPKKLRIFLRGENPGEFYRQ